MAAAKTYYSHIIGCRFIAPDGSEHFFTGGQLTTTDETVQKELDKQILRGGNFVITNKPKSTEVDKAALAALVAVKETAAKAAELTATAGKVPAPAVE